MTFAATKFGHTLTEILHILLFRTHIQEQIIMRGYNVSNIKFVTNKRGIVSFMEKP